MKIETRHDLAASAAARHFQQYESHPPDFRTNDGGDPREVNKRLVALGATPNPDDVDEIMGNTSWTMLDKCDECGRGELERVLLIGGFDAGFGHNDRIALCDLCIEKAFKLTLT